MLAGSIEVGVPAQDAYLNSTYKHRCSTSTQKTNSFTCLKLTITQCMKNIDLSIRKIYFSLDHFS